MHSTESGKKKREEKLGILFLSKSERRNRNDETLVSNSGRHHGRKEKGSGKREREWIKLGHCDGDQRASV
jgi:hypothetical protein